MPPAWVGVGRYSGVTYFAFVDASFWAPVHRETDFTDPFNFIGNSFEDTNSHEMTQPRALLQWLNRSAHVASLLGVRLIVFLFFRQIFGNPT